MSLYRTLGLKIPTKTEAKMMLDDAIAYNRRFAFNRSTFAFGYDISTSLDKEIHISHPASVATILELPTTLRELDADIFRFELSFEYNGFLIFGRYETKEDIEKELKYLTTP